MDAVVKVQLLPERNHSAQEYVNQLRDHFKTAQWADLEFSFDAGGMIRSAMNDGRSSPINVQLTARDAARVYPIAEAILKEARKIDGVVDGRIIHALDYPQYFIEVNQAKAADIGLNQVDIMKNVIATLNSSVQYQKNNFWIDPVTTNQYYVGVAFRGKDIQSLDDLLDVIITSPAQKSPIQWQRGNLPQKYRRQRSDPQGLANNR